MKITIEIPDEDIRQEVCSLLTQRIAECIFTNRYTPDMSTYRRILKEGVNAVLKDHADEIIESCIPQAASYIGKKGVKKLVEKLADE